MLTIAAVAAHKGIAPQRIEVQVHRRTVEAASWQTTFSVEIDLGPGLSRREQILLYNAARRCEVHKLLEGDLTFGYQLTGTS
ncbi:MAG: OsmC family protein [Anaerolineae bacterium]